MESDGVEVFGGAVKTVWGSMLVLNSIPINRSIQDVFRDVKDVG